MSIIDILFIIILFGALALGIFQGTIKLLVAIIALYASIVLASLYYQALGVFFRDRFNSTLEVGQITGFAVILMVTFLLLTIAGLYTFRYAQIPASLDFVDRMLGTLLGLVLGALFLGMLAILLRILFTQNVAGTLQYPFMITIQDGVRRSQLIPFFANNVLPLIYASVRPILPEQADFIFGL